VARLVLNPGSSLKREVELPRSILLIGRDPGNDLVLPDAMVSRRHAVIEYRGSRYYLRDCNSSNGSLVNGDRVSERGLRDGDMVAIGTARLLFRDDLHEDTGPKVIPHPSAPRRSCPTCRADYRRGDAFCRECGAGLPAEPPERSTCPACGTRVPLPARFCTGCGVELPGLAVASSPTEEHGASAGVVPAAEDVGAPPAAAAPARPEAGRAATPAAARRPAPLPIAPPAPRRTLPPLPAARQRAGAEPEPPGLDRRFAAAIIDAGLVALGQLLVLTPTLLYWWSRELPASLGALPLLPVALSLLDLAVALGLGALYFALFWGVRGATPGKQLLGLAVEGRDGSYPIGLPRALVRVFGYLLSALPLGAGFLMIAFGGRGLHDHLAGTRVVERDAS